MRTRTYTYFVEKDDNGNIISIKTVQPITKCNNDTKYKYIDYEFNPEPETFKEFLSIISLPLAMVTLWITMVILISTGII